MRHSVGALQTQRVFTSLKVTVVNQALAEKKRLMETTSATHERAKADLVEAKKAADQAKSLAKRKIDEAKKAGDPSNDMKEAFDSLSKDIDELRALLAEQKGLARLTDDTNEDVVVEYENREKEIAEKKEDLAKKISSLETLKKDVAELEALWKPRVIELVKKVSESFGEFMKSKFFFLLRLFQRNF